ncbi:hypothetical protein BGW80DRAFT_1334084, partial [Lactifluus volemus]
MIYLRYIAFGKTNKFSPHRSYRPLLAIVTPCNEITFPIWLFESLGYSYRERVARRRVDIKVDIPLFICGETRNTRAGICIVDRNDSILLLVQPEAKRSENTVPINVHAQLVVKAIAAFNENDRRREAVGLPPLVEKVMPGIVMLRTFPVFFKISVTETLSTHIRHGTYPPEETRVMYCYPHLPLPARRRSEAMKLPDNRREILRCYEAFKSIV